MNVLEMRAEMHEIIALLHNARSTSVVYAKLKEAIETIEDEGDWWDELSLVQQSELIASVKECDDPKNLAPHDQAVKTIEQWLSENN